MSILILCISLLICIIAIIVEEKSKTDLCDYLFPIFFLFGLIFAFSFIVTIALGTKCSKLSKIDDIIAMYQEENESIESRMDDLVKGYMDYEKNTLTEFAPESSITLVSLYPELKSDELVKQQIDVYMTNNQKIKELKEKRIYTSVYRWWLYFGT